MIDRKALIREAAKAMWAANGPEEWERATGAEQGEHLTLARAALAVFEKALGEATVTPTDDEREAQGWREAALYAEDAESQDDFMTGWRTADRTRSEVPEPSAECPQCGVRVTDQTPSTFYAHHDESCGGPLEEPQGEPSDAQVEKVARVLLGATVDSMLVARELAAIALRAASEAGGEGR